MGKKGDPKVPILLSTTRRGTALSTSATLDSPSVMSKFASPPPHDAPTESVTMSDTLDMLLLLLMILVRLVMLLRNKLLLLLKSLELNFLLLATLLVKLMIILI